MTDVPHHIRNRFLTYLNDYIQEHTEFAPVFEGKVPNQVMFQEENKITYTVIRFSDDTWAIVPNAYTEFLVAMKSTEDARPPQPV